MISTFEEDMKENYTEKESTNTITNESLQKIARGTGIVIIGTIVGMFFSFVGRIVVVRYISQSEYGIYSLAIVLISIFVTISSLGLTSGSTRYIAYYRGTKEERKIRGAVSSSIKIVLFVSLVLFSFL